MSSRLSDVWLSRVNGAVPRVVVTGLGVVSPAGQSVRNFWPAIVAGDSAIRPITLVPAEQLTSKIAAEVADFDPSDHFEAKTLSLMDRFSQFAVVAARQAIADAGLEARCGLTTATIIGSGVGGQTTLDESYKRLYGANATRLHPFTIPRLMLNAAASHVSMDLRLGGPAFAIASACASGTHALGQAFRMVRDGDVEIAVSGGTEACLTLGTLKAWEALRVMSADTCRPFSHQRSGMVLGEGAAIVVLESLECARVRGARIYAEIVGFGMSADAGDITLPDASGAARAMTAALRDARLEPDMVDYVNAHGTGTTVNDVVETEALHRVFGDHARRLAVSSSKAVLGHSLGAAGALEVLVTTLAIAHALAPPTANFLEADPACDLDYVPNEARDLPIEAAISNSFAFGGLNAVIALSRFHE
jgi:nodulation protein E